MNVLTDKETKILDAYFRECNYLSVGQLYLLDNPLLREDLKWEHIKKKIVAIVQVIVVFVNPILIAQKLAIN